VVVLTVLLPSTAWCIPHVRVSCTDCNSSRTGAITHNSIRGNSSRHSSSSSTVLLPHCYSKLPSGHHSSFPLVTFPATTMGRWGTLLESAASQANQLTVSFGTRGQSTEGRAEGSYAMDWPHQLYHHGGDSHGRRSASRYVLPQ
jgi:hypothetical protein